jgi:hypothetical protein
VAEDIKKIKIVMTARMMMASAKFILSGREDPFLQVGDERLLRFRSGFVVAQYTA